MNRITKEQAKEFYENLCKAFNGSESKTCQGVASVALIAQRMEIPIVDADRYCTAMLYYGVTERQSGRIVIQEE